MKIKIGIIQKTDEIVDFNKTNIEQQIEDILDDMTIFNWSVFETEETDKHKINHELLEHITDLFGEKNAKLTAVNIIESKSYLYAGYFIDYTETMIGKTEEELEEQKKNFRQEDLNTFASQLTSHNVVSKMIIVKYDLFYEINQEKQNIKTIMNISKFQQYELQNELVKIYRKEGCIIHPNNDISAYPYINNPLEHLILTDKNYQEHYRIHEYEVYSKILKVIVDNRENTNINLYASRLCGHKVYGTVFVSMCKKALGDEDTPYEILSIDVLKELIRIRGCSTHLTTKFSTDTRKYYVNFEKLVSIENKKVSENEIKKYDYYEGQEKCLNEVEDVTMIEIGHNLEESNNELE
jgi:uncharacterized protein YfkK (UPF0435 family)